MRQNMPVGGRAAAIESTPRPPAARDARRPQARGNRAGSESDEPAGEDVEHDGLSATLQIDVPAQATRPAEVARNLYISCPRQLGAGAGSLLPYRDA